MEFSPRSFPTGPIEISKKNIWQIYLVLFLWLIQVWFLSQYILFSWRRRVTENEDRTWSKEKENMYSVWTMKTLDRERLHSYATLEW